MEYEKNLADDMSDHMIDKNTPDLDADQLKSLFKRHFQGALVRSIASISFWLLLLLSYYLNSIDNESMVGISLSVAFLVFINPPTLLILKLIKSKRLYEYFSTFINFLEIIGYTGVIYFLGGVNALYLSPIYAALIAYVGAVGHPIHPFIVASLCGATLCSMAGLEYFGYLAHRDPFFNLSLSGMRQVTILAANIGLLYIIASISSYTCRLRNRNKERLRQQNTELEKANEAKSQFLANMSHELRTPLNHIIGFTELVLDGNSGELNETQAEYLNDVHGSSKHLLSLINDILDLSKVEAGKLELEPSDVDLKMLLENSLVMVGEKALKHGIRISAEMDGIPEIIKADERKLKQIMYNLLSNAMKFTPDGGEVYLSARRLARDGSVEISVMDNGIGIKEKEQERVFKPFEQAESNANGRYGGTGLGLSLTRSLVELHGGKIRVESKGEGKGSKFSFIIPISVLPKSESKDLQTV
ncbi:sensor histidine kinase [Thermodesulfobacteriota bacterium]